MFTPQARQIAHPEPVSLEDARELKQRDESHDHETEAEEIAARGFMGGVFILLVAVAAVGAFLAGIWWGRGSAP